ncbi:MAG: hypothetical protein M5R42_18735 [Rhodocyclaceae bacterium]|nr:hypothetical protein [Rhodocyclaceae bacterium]
MSSRLPPLQARRKSGRTPEQAGVELLYAYVPNKAEFLLLSPQHPPSPLAAAVSG